MKPARCHREAHPALWRSRTRSVEIASRARNDVTRTKWEAKHMQKHFVWLWLVGFFGLVVAADAQTPSSPAAKHAI